MSDKTVKPAHFWIGIIITIVTIIAGVFQTNQKISEQRNENRLVQISAVLKDVSKATNEVSGQLESQASMYLVMQNCIRKSQDKFSCWRNNTLFNPSESVSAWNTLDSTIAYSSPFMSEDREIEILEQMKNLKRVHQERVRSINPPATEKDAYELITLISKSKTELSKMTEELNEQLSNRLRNANK